MVLVSNSRCVVATTQLDGGANDCFMDIAFAFELGVPTMKYEHLAKYRNLLMGSRYPHMQS